MDIREPRFAGLFYPANRTELIRSLEWCFKHDLGPGLLPTEVEPSQMYNIRSAVAPHAGYIYSGPCAAHTYLAIREDRIPDTVIILGPNHTGYGSPISVYPRGIWRTPLGDVKIDTEIANKLISTDPFEADTLAHLEEHSIEVQLPFMQFTFRKEFKIVPITIMDQRLKVIRNVAGAIYDLMEESNKNIIVIATSDMSHYVPNDVAYERDLKALERVEKLDVEGFYEVVERENVTACGIGPIAASMLIAKYSGSKGALLKYYTSGDITGDQSAVVGYASVIFGDIPFRIKRYKVRKEKIQEAPLPV